MGRKHASSDLLRFLSCLENVNVVGVLTDNHLDGSPTTMVAEELGLTIYDYDSALDAMANKELTFDLGVSFLYWRKLKGDFLKIPKLGVINFHPAPLPQYKGTGGYNLAILEGLTEWGVSAHYVDQDIDTGEIIEVNSFKIDEKKETVVTLEKKSMNMLTKLARRIIVKAASNPVMLSTIPNIGGRYLSRNEMEELKKIQDGDDVERKVRAFWFPPYTGAYIEIDGNKYTLINDEMLSDLSPPGTTSLFSNSK